MKRFTGLLVGLGIGAMLILIGLLDGHTPLYRPHWNPTQGEVVAHEPVGPGADPALTRVWVRYTTAAGRTLEMPREFNLNRYPQFNIGNPVTVLYNAPNPLQHFIRQPNTPQDMLGVAALGLGSVVVLGTVAHTARKAITTRKGESQPA